MLQETIVLLFLNGHCFIDLHSFRAAGDYRIVDLRRLLFFIYTVSVLHVTVVLLTLDVFCFVDLHSAAGDYRFVDLKWLLFR